MTGCDRAGMDKPIALRHLFRDAWIAGRFRGVLCGFAWLALLLTCLPWLMPAISHGSAGGSINQLVHWQDDAHDWLLVVDPRTREVVVYDAVDGRPLGRLGVDEGLPQVRSIALHGQRLVVTGSRAATVRLLDLPALRANAD